MGSAKASLIIVATAIMLLGSSYLGAQSDESGTLVIAARTKGEVILAIDSQVTRTDFHGPDVMGEPTPLKKLVDIGERGSCAIVGWEGDGTRGIVVANDIRRVLEQHPQTDLSGLMGVMLDSAAKTWDGAEYQLDSLPRHRQPGGLITELVCVGKVGGRPSILVGRTTVSNTGAAIPGQIPLECGGLFYLNGYLQLNIYFDIADAPENAKYWSEPGTNRYAKLPQVAASLSSDDGARAALSVLKAELKPILIEGRLTCATVPDTIAPRSWTLPLIRSLFMSLFNSVEQNSSEVAKPNNLRIVSQAGVVSSTVEAAWHPR